MSQKIRIVSGGLGSNTRVYDVDGNEIDHTLSVAWRVNGPGIASATIEVNRVQADIWAEAEFIERVAGSPSLILAAIQAELARQIEIHPVRPRHPYHWLAVFSEELHEAALEACRLAQEQAESGSVDARLEAAKRLRTELVQVAAVACAWAESLPVASQDGAKETTGRNPDGNPSGTDRAFTGHPDTKEREER